jgi:integrase
MAGAKGRTQPGSKGHLENILPRHKLTRAHLVAMPYADVPAFFKELSADNCTSTLALAFLILTAARSSEVRGALWSEIDVEGKVWAIPPERMKMGLLHRIPLTDAALEILNQMDKVRHNHLIFAGQRPNRPWLVSH